MENESNLNVLIEKSSIYNAVTEDYNNLENEGNYNCDCYTCQCDGGCDCVCQSNCCDAGPCYNG